MKTHLIHCYILLSVALTVLQATAASPFADPSADRGALPAVPPELDVSFFEERAGVMVKLMDCLSAVSLAEKTADRMVRLMGCSLEVPCKHNKVVVSLGLP